MEGQTIQWSKEKGQKAKQLSTNHYTEKERLSHRTPQNPEVNWICKFMKCVSNISFCNIVPG
jgi:hypothetical protein